MTAATKTSAPSAPAAPALTPEQTEQLARAQSYLKLEEYTKTQHVVIAKRRSDEEDKLFTDLAAIPDLSVNTRVADRLKTFETSVGAIDTEKAQLHRFEVLLKARQERFAAEQADMLRYALEQRLKILLDTHVKEQKEADAVEAEIKIVKKRLDEICAHTGSAKAAAKA